MSRGWTRWDDTRLAQLRDLATNGMKRKAIAMQMGTSPGAITIVAQKHGITLPGSRGPRGDGGPKYDTSRQRRFIGVGESNGPKVELGDWHPALRNGSTIFGQTVIPAARAERLFKSGMHNRKIGAIAQKGWLKGMPIFTLTLEERATCPSTCLEWATCYGNNMGRAPRLADDGTLTRRLWAELAYLAAHHSAGFVLRLHVLGDFYSTDYVQFWHDALTDFPMLHIFGFTARQPDDPIGRAVLGLMEDFEGRCIIRVSGGGLPELCSEVVDKGAAAIGIVCPAEKDADRCCATCGLCWTSTRTITFLRH